MGQMFLMHAYSSVCLVSTCNATANAECVTNGVVRFLVCCATFALSVVLLFHCGVVFFFGPCLFQRLVTNFSFEPSLRKFRFESTSSGIRVGVRSGVWVSGCAGVWVCW